MIKLTLKDIVPMVNSLNIVMSLPLPAKDSYRLGIAAKMIQEKLIVYEKARYNLVTKYGEKVESENVIRVKVENIDSFNKEIEELLAESIEINMNPIPIDKLEDNKIYAIDMANLSPFFCESSQ